MQKSIISSDSIVPINQNFRIAAGPGAGKTKWLVSHITNALQNSRSLGKNRKIACVTYTNLAVETIVRRLGEAANSVEVSTVHSFLFRNVVGPYQNQIRQLKNVGQLKYDGGADRWLTGYSHLSQWKAKTGQQYITDDLRLISAFKGAYWQFNDSGGLEWKPGRTMFASGYAIKDDSYAEYKDLLWKHGILHHEDVLYFSHELIAKYPFIVSVLNARFPYFYIDEFQDVNAIQAVIIEKLGSTDTFVGIIGDRAQAIYGFRGTVPGLFTSFRLPNIVDYEIEDNYRSSQEIVDVLNSIRSDITQKSKRGNFGFRPRIYTGELRRCVEHLQNNFPKEVFTFLAWSNATVRNCKQGNFVPAPRNALNLVRDMESADQNTDRRDILTACILALQRCKNGNIPKALRELIKVTSLKDRETECINFLRRGITDRLNIESGNLTQFLDRIRDQFGGISRLQEGAAKRFYDSQQFQIFADHVDDFEDSSEYRTIHKSKGDEFQNVVLVLGEQSNLDFLLAKSTSRSIHDNETFRLMYVAVSRARDRLVIWAPTATASFKRATQNLFDFHHMP